MKKKLIAILIGLVVMVGPFRYAFSEQDYDHPMVSMGSFLLVIIGTLVCMFFFLGTEEKH